MNKEKINFLQMKLNYWYPKLETIMKKIAETEDQLIEEYKVQE